MNIQTITVDDRPWATGNYVAFLGQYLKLANGLSFKEGTTSEQLERLSSTFDRLPTQLKDICHKYGMTVSVAFYPWTMAQDSASIYADWENPDASKVSPHIELGTRSLEQYLLPHLTHEVCHLWWRRSCQQSRSDMSSYLVLNTGREEIEVSLYVHRMFQEYIRYTSEEDGLRTPEQRENVARLYLDRWTEDAFCDTAAAIVVPQYSGESSKNWQATVDLAARRRAIAQIMNLTLEA